MAKAPNGKTAQHYNVGQNLFFPAFQALQKISTGLASSLAYQLWFHPSKSAKSRNRVFSPPGSEKRSMRVSGKTFPTWSAGKGQTVLLVHGWSGWGGQMAAIGTALLKKGYRVIWFDAPAHGQASGWRTHIFEISESLRSIESHYGKIDYVVAHSFGLPATFRAIVDGMQIEKIVGMSAPAAMRDLVKAFCLAIKANQAVHDGIVKRIEKDFGSDIWQRISAYDIAPQINQPIRLFHDKQDSWVSCKNSLALKRKLADVELTLTEGLGHHRILRDKDVIDGTLDFLQMEPADIHKRKIV